MLPCWRGAFCCLFVLQTVALPLFKCLMYVAMSIAARFSSRPWLFRHNMTPVLVSNKTQVRVTAIFPANEYYFSQVFTPVSSTSLSNQKLATLGIFLHSKHHISMGRSKLRVLMTSLYCGSTVLVKA